jgi:hypothetical protein
MILILSDQQQFPLQLSFYFCYTINCFRLRRLHTKVFQCNWVFRRPPLVCLRIELHSIALYLGLSVGSTTPPRDKKQQQQRKKNNLPNANLTAGVRLPHDEDLFQGSVSSGHGCLVSVKVSQSPLSVDFGLNYLL